MLTNLKIKCLFSQQVAILSDLRTDIKKEFNFIAMDNHFEIISGKQEGMYAWMAINYALGRFEHATSFGNFYFIFICLFIFVMAL